VGCGYPPSSSATACSARIVTEHDARPRVRDGQRRAERDREPGRDNALRRQQVVGDDGVARVDARGDQGAADQRVRAARGAEHPALVAQVGQRDLRPGGKWVIAREHDEHRVLEQPLAVQRPGQRRVVGREHDREIGRARGDGRQRLTARRRAELHGEGGVLRAQALDRARDEVHERRREREQLDTAGAQRAQVAERIFRGAGAVEHRPCVGEQRLPRRGERDAAGVPDEQRHPGLCLQPRELVRHRRLAELERARRR
jgi:hypothetical protein